MEVGAIVQNRFEIDWVNVHETKTNQNLLER
jgi:hypothetical protein